MVCLDGLHIHDCSVNMLSNVLLLYTVVLLGKFHYGKVLVCTVRLKSNSNLENTLSFRKVTTETTSCAKSGNLLCTRVVLPGELQGMHLCSPSHSKRTLHGAHAHMLPVPRHRGHNTAVQPYCLYPWFVLDHIKLPHRINM